MTLRTVLAVALAVSVLAVAMPGVEHARHERTARHVRGETGALVDAAESLLARDEVAPVGEPGARRVVTVTIPRAGWDAAALDYLAIGGSPGSPAEGSATTGVVAFRIRDRPERRVRVPVQLAPAGGNPLVLREAGDHRLVLSLRRPGDHRVVVVRRFG